MLEIVEFIDSKVAVVPVTWLNQEEGDLSQEPSKEINETFSLIRKLS